MQAMGVSVGQTGLETHWAVIFRKQLKTWEGILEP